MDDLQISANISTRRPTDSFVVHFYKKEISRKLISYLGTKIWNDLNPNIKASPCANSLKHALIHNYML